MRQYLLLILGASIIFSASAYAQDVQDIEIVISSPTYNYGDKLDYTIIISEVTEKMRLFLLQILLEIKANYYQYQ